MMSLHLLTYLKVLKIRFELSYSHSEVNRSLWTYRIMFKNLFLFFILVSCTVARLPEFDNNRGKIFGLLTQQLRTIFQPGSTWWRKFVNAKKIEKCGNCTIWNQNLKNHFMMPCHRNKKCVMNHSSICWIFIHPRSTVCVSVPIFRFHSFIVAF